MKNAHERFGRLVYVRRTEKTQTNIVVHLESWVGEEGKAHFVSVIGGDAIIGALAAAFAAGDRFTIVDPEKQETIVSLGEKPVCFRGAVTVANRKRPLRHLVAVSQEMIGAEAKHRLLLIHDAPAFVWASLVVHFGLPAMPDWAGWFMSELQRRKRIQQLLGFGYCPIAIRIKRQELLSLIRQGLVKGALKFPEANGPADWPRLAFGKSTANAVCDSQGGDPWHGTSSGGFGAVSPAAACSTMASTATAAEPTSSPRNIATEAAWSR